MPLADRHPRLNFARLLNKLKPTDGELRKAESFREGCKTRLQKSFNLNKFVKIGSHSREAAIKHFSDLDFLAVLARNEAKWGGKVVNSNTFISRVAQDLSSRYAATNIRKDQQAVVLNFGQGQNSMDVVPGFFKEIKNKCPVYQIPDGSGGWLETSPEGHNALINKENARSQGKLKNVGKILRHWKYSRTTHIPISSFYIDLLLAESGVCTGVKSYSQILYEFFQLMHARKCAGFYDPLGVSGLISPASTKQQINSLNTSIDFAFAHAVKALIAEQNTKFNDANHHWDILFNRNFI